MNKILTFLVIFSISVFAANEQLFIHEIYQNASSKIARSADLSIFADRLGSDGLLKMSTTCNSGFRPHCLVDLEKKSVYIEEYVSSDNPHYTFVSDGGFPYVTYTLTISSIPTDKFVSDTDRLMVQSGAINGTGPSAPLSLDLTRDNSNFLSVVRMLNTNLSYFVIMPGSITSATAGNYSASIYPSTLGPDQAGASFDLAHVMQNRSPMIIKSKELNTSMLVVVFAVIVFAIIAYMFFGSSRKVVKAAPKPEVKKPKKKV
ncbi:MAG: hypothetical protein ACP5N9_00895 [Candidatus Bilamarchaeum sp.]|jgi:hypothetical protein